MIRFWYHIITKLLKAESCTVLICCKYLHSIKSESSIWTKICSSKEGIFYILYRVCFAQNVHETKQNRINVNYFYDEFNINCSHNLFCIQSTAENFTQILTHIVSPTIFFFLNNLMYLVHVLRFNQFHHRLKPKRVKKN